MSEMKGIISVKGNEPHIYLAFTTENGIVYIIEGPMAKDLREKYQGSKVKVKAKVVKEKDESIIRPGVIEIYKVIGEY